MKKTWLKRAGYGLLALIALTAAVVAVLAGYGHLKASRKLEVRLETVAARSDAVAIERGGYLFRSRGCTECHGSDGAGRTFVDDGKGLHLHAPNITPARGSVVASYRMDDWDRTLRHGVAPGGRPLLIMPSEDYNRFTNDDLAALLAHVQSLPPAPGQGAIVELPLPARVLYGFGLIKDAAAKIDHTRPPQQPVAEGVTTAHGAYVANMCIGCHGATLAGGKIPGGPPDWPAASNLTPGEGSVMGRYPDAESLMRMFRSGKRPDGSAIKVMPFESLREMNDTDLRALLPATAPSVIALETIEARKGSAEQLVVAVEAALEEVVHHGLAEELHQRAVGQPAQGLAHAQAVAVAGAQLDQAQRVQPGEAGHALGLGEAVGGGDLRGCPLAQHAQRQQQQARVGHHGGLLRGGQHRPLGLGFGHLARQLGKVGLQHATDGVHPGQRHVAAGQHALDAGFGQAQLARQRGIGDAGTLELGLEHLHQRLGGGHAAPFVSLSDTRLSSGRHFASRC